MDDSSNEAQQPDPSENETQTLMTISRDATRSALEGSAGTLTELSEGGGSPEAWCETIESFAFDIGTASEHTAFEALGWLRDYNFEISVGDDMEFEHLVRLFHAGLSGVATSPRVRAHQDWLDADHEWRLRSQSPAEQLVKAAWEVAKKCTVRELIEGPESMPWW